MTAPDAGAIRRLDAVLRLAANPGTEGERDAALLAAARLLAADPDKWRERLIVSPSVAPAPAHTPSYGRPAWRILATECASADADLLTSWEHEFIASLLRRARSRISEKQTRCLHRICEKLGVEIPQ